MKLRTAAAATVAAALAFAVLLASPAYAAGVAWVPGDTGLSTADAGSTASANCTQTRGGWDENYVGTSMGRSTAVPAGERVLPVALYLGEPVRDTTQYSIPLCTRSLTPTDMASVTYRLPGVAAGAQTGVVRNVLCGSTRNATTASSTYPLRNDSDYAAYPAPSGISGVSANDVAGNVATPRLLALQTGSGFGISGSSRPCAYLQRIDIDICFYSTSIVWTCDTFTWLATRLDHTYGSNASSDEWKYDTCDALGAVGQPQFCLDYVVVTDPTSFSQVCSNGPTPVWAVWDWLVAFIGYYGRCLFEPRGGWDSGGEIEAIWPATGLGEVEALLTDTVEVFTITEGCGPVLDATATPLPLYLDSCSWTWAAPAKVFIGWTAGLAFALWGVAFIVQLVMSLVKAAPMPLPLVTDAALGPAEPGSR